MLSGLHETMHLVECTLDFVPLNYTNAFPFEEINRKIMKFIHGSNLVGEEFIKNLSTFKLWKVLGTKMLKMIKLLSF